MLILICKIILENLNSKIRFFWNKFLHFFFFCNNNDTFNDHAQFISSIKYCLRLWNNITHINACVIWMKFKRTELNIAMKGPLKNNISVKLNIAESFFVACLAHNKYSLKRALGTSESSYYTRNVAITTLVF